MHRVKVLIVYPGLVGPSVSSRPGIKRLEKQGGCLYGPRFAEKQRRTSMISRLLLAVIVAATFGLSACGKTDEHEAEHKAPATGMVEEGKGATEHAMEAPKEGAEEAAQH
jgi:hypothetical protein